MRRFRSRLSGRNKWRPYKRNDIFESRSLHVKTLNFNYRIRSPWAEPACRLCLDYFVTVVLPVLIASLTPGSLREHRCVPSQKLPFRKTKRLLWLTACQTPWMQYEDFNSTYRVKEFNILWQKYQYFSENWNSVIKTVSGAHSTLMLNVCNH